MSIYRIERLLNTKPTENVLLYVSFTYSMHSDVCSFGIQLIFVTRFYFLIAFSATQNDTLRAIRIASITCTNTQALAHAQHMCERLFWTRRYEYGFGFGFMCTEYTNIHLPKRF